jgi:hypothetical protein
MVELTAIINRAQVELDGLKELARAEANGNTLALQGDVGTVTVSKPSKGYTTLDVNALKVKAPKMYADLMERYSKTTTGAKASVKVYLSK